MVDGKTKSGGTVEASEGVLRELLKDVPSDVRRRVSQEIGVLIEDHVQGERERCVGICRRRAKVWRSTSAARGTVASARAEARARANEALYLADLIESGADVSGVAGPDAEDA
jgi:hypothetical protein